MGWRSNTTCKLLGFWQGGFGGNIDHDAHLLYTLSAVQILALLDKIDLLDRDKVADYVVALQQPDGSFYGDEWGEVDSRFSYCALNCLSLLGRLDRANVVAAVAFVTACRNFDGGYGCIPGAESHGGQIFCCVGALAIAGALDQVDADLLGWWLCERQVAPFMHDCSSPLPSELTLVASTRQVPGGGLNGRPEKLPDVCYSWWILTSLTILGRLDWIDGARLREFILHAQDVDEGGIADRSGPIPTPMLAASPGGFAADPRGGKASDRARVSMISLVTRNLRAVGRPGDEADVFHTYFGLCGLSLLAHHGAEGQPDGAAVAPEAALLERIDPVYALPVPTLRRLGLPVWGES